MWPLRRGYIIQTSSGLQANYIFVIFGSVLNLPAQQPPAGY